MRKVIVLATLVVLALAKYGPAVEPIRDDVGVCSRNGKNRTLRRFEGRSTKRKRSKIRLQRVLRDHW